MHSSAKTLTKGRVVAVRYVMVPRSDVAAGLKTAFKIGLVENLVNYVQ